MKLYINLTIMINFNINYRMLKQEDPAIPEPMELKKHRNRRLINKHGCGMSCETQQSCKKVEEVLSFLKKLRLILRLYIINQSFDRFDYLLKIIHF